MENKPSQNRLKILFIIPYFVPAWNLGGPIRGAYEVARRIALKGHRITILTTDVYKKGLRVGLREQIIQGIKIIYLANWVDYFAYKYKFYQPRGIRRWLKHHLIEYDLVHIQNVYSIMTFFSCKYSIARGIPYLISIRGVLSPIPQQKKVLLKSVFNRLLFPYLKRANMIIAQTTTESDDIKKFSFSNIMIVRNGIDLEKYKYLPYKEIFRNKFGIEENEVVILYLGRINEVKGIKYLIEAISDIKDLPFKLIIIGEDDNYLPTLLNIINKKNIQGKVILINGLYGKEKIEAYAAADIFCLPSLYDCAPNSMLEACACGLPIITTYNNGLCHIVDDGAGMLVHSKNSKEIKAALINLITNPEMRMDMGQYAKKRIFSDYSWDIITNDLEKIYHEITQKRSHKKG